MEREKEQWFFILFYLAFHPINTGFYSSLFLNILSVYSLSISIATISLQATIIIFPNYYCSLLNTRLLPSSPQECES